MAFKKFPKSIRQYLDQDYIERLSDSEKEWLLTFNVAFYLGESCDNGKPGQERKRLANRDIMNKEVHEIPKPKLKSPKRYYTVDDYRPESASIFADALIEAIDREQEKKIIPISRGKRE